MSFDEDNEFGEEGSSDEEANDQEEAVEDQDEGADDDGDQDDDDDGDGEGDGDEDEDGENADGDDTEMQDVTQNSQGPSDKRPGALAMPSDSQSDPLKLTPTQGQLDGQQADGEQTQEDSTTMVDQVTVRPEALTAATYDIVPTIAAPQSTSINCVTATRNMKYVFSGGSDGYIRKFNWPDTANGKLMLTVAQRHPFVDTVTKAGVLMSYWENEEGNGKPDSLSPVYSLAVGKHAIWLLSGLESGGINLQSVRHEEGKLIHRLKQHTSAVSVLELSPDERSVLSGSWDKKIFDWDLDTGRIIRKYDSNASQIAAVEVRPESSLPVPKAEEPPRLANGTYSSNNASKPTPSGQTNGVPQQNGTGPSQGQPSPAPSDNSFASLFGDDDNENAMDTNFGGAGGDEDNDLFGGAVTNDMRPGEEPVEDASGDATMTDAPVSMEGVTSEPAVPAPADAGAKVTEVTGTASPEKLTNGAASTDSPLQASNTHISEPMAPTSSTVSADAPAQQSANTFLSASIDGSIRVWDRRVSSAVVKLPSRYAPPWCMSAIWSPDGNSFYAGRRNGSVEEYSLHKPLAAPSRTFRFPSGSGPVSALKAMPNGRHLVCASFDILRLYDLQHEEKAGAVVGKTPFLIVPGHRTGVVSSLYLDQTCNFMISTAGTRGWEGTSTQVLLGYEIGI